MRTVISITAVCLSLFIITGCSALKMGQSPEKSLQAKVETVWEAKTVQNWKALYDATTAEYKEAFDEKKFLGLPKISIVEYEVKDIDMNPEKNSAVVTVKYKVSQSGYEIPFETKETWLLNGSDWEIDFLKAMGVPKK